MKIKIKRLNLLVAAIFISLPYSVAAHHSMTEFDRSGLEEAAGIVTRVSWKNPHILFEVTSTSDNGTETVYTFEGNAKSMLSRRGLSGDELAVGDVVRAAGWPSTRRENYLQVEHLLLPNGVELLLARAKTPLWANEAIGAGRDLFDPELVATATGEGIFRVWSQGGPAFFFSDRSGWKLTAAASAAVAEWDPIEDDPNLKCIAPGMPGAMGNPYPMEFTQVGDNIEIQFEEFDSLRVIHMGDDVAKPSEVDASHLGYSVGRWEGETLVVETSRINWPYFNRAGAPQTEKVTINEQFTVVDGGNRLNYVMRVDDPETLVEPFVWNAHFVWKPGEQVNTYNCELEDWASTEKTLTN